jgi:DNA-binding CsgD family transcriptional regulator
MSETRLKPLTRRQEQALRLIALNCSTGQIAKLMGVTPNTADTMRQNAMRNIGIRGTAGVTLYAVRTGIVAAHNQLTPEEQRLLRR